MCVIHPSDTALQIRVLEDTGVWSYLGVELRQLLFINVSLGVDTSFIAELKHKNKYKMIGNVVFLSLF